MKNYVIVDEYLAHWVGWATEDQSWIPRTNFSGDDVPRDFNENHDPYREIPDDIKFSIEQLVFKDDLKKLPKKSRALLQKKRKRSSVGSERGKKVSKQQGKKKAVQYDEENEDEDESTTLFSSSQTEQYETNEFIKNCQSSPHASPMDENDEDKDPAVQQLIQQSIIEQLQAAVDAHRDSDDDQDALQVRNHSSQQYQQLASAALSLVEEDAPHDGFNFMAADAEDEREIPDYSV